jgi:hypothetical protein
MEKGSKWAIVLSILALFAAIATAQSSAPLLTTEDVEPPEIAFIPPTPANGSTVSVNYVFINVTVTEASAIEYVLLTWDGTVETMYMGGVNFWYSNKTNLQNGLYTYKVSANDTYNNWGVSETRIVRVGKCGDVNCDETVDMSDVIDLLYYVGYPGNYTIGSEWSADVNCDKAIDRTDVRALLHYVGYPGQSELSCCEVSG